MECGKRINKCEKKVCKSALRTCCAERTRAMLLAACVHLMLVPFSGIVCVKADMGTSMKKTKSFSKASKNAA